MDGQSFLIFQRKDPISSAGGDCGSHDINEGARDATIREPE